MYSLKDKKKAVDLLIKYDHAYTQVMRELGYPNSRTTLTKWNKELKETGKLKVCYQRRSRYSDKEKIDAVNHYLEHGRNISRTIRKIGYPNRVLLGKWIDELAFEEKKVSRAGGVVVRFNQRVLDLAKQGKLTEGHCRALLAYEDGDKQLAEAIKLIEKGRSVRDIERKTQRNKPKKVDQRYVAICNDIEDSFQSFFGTKVKVDAGKRSGKIIIQYSTNDDLARILDLIK